MLPKDSTVYVGAVGDDEAAKVLQKEANKDGLRTAYQITNYPTGKCAVLINGVHRSMVTDLQAANQFSIDHLDKSEIWEFVTKANYYYIGGYFLTVSPPSAIKIAKHSVEKGKSLSLNLAAPFISQFFKDPLDELLEYTNVVFGNEAEAEAFSTSHGFGTVNVKEIAKKIAEFPKKFKGDRLVVLTQGADDTIVYYQGNVTSYPIKKIDPKDIVDCNGAGDAFVGGFLSQFVQGKSVTDSIRGGHYLAHVVIQRTGPSYPTTPHEFK
jgi:adenosine kinase